jgi:cytoskeletal protein RodZ
MGLTQELNTSGMMVETVGRKLQRARLAKKLEIDEVAEATKIRPDRIIDLEADEYGHFPNLTYAKSFLTKYAQFLGVDIREELESFQVGRSISLGEYQYLTSPPVSRTSSEPRRIEARGFRVPPLLVIALILIVLVGVPLFSYLAVNVSRLHDDNPTVAATDESEKEPPKTVVPDESATPAADSLQSIAQAREKSEPANSPTPPAGETNGQIEGATPYASRGHDESGVEVRRALPVDPVLPSTENIVKTEATPFPDKKLEVRLLRRTWVKVTRDEEDAQPVYEGFAGPDSRPIIVVGKKFWVRVRDKSAVEVRKDGQLVLGSSDDIVIN